MKRLPMRKIRDALRLQAAGLAKRQIAASLGVGRTTARDYLARAERAGLSWPLPDDADTEKVKTDVDEDVIVITFPKRK